MSIASTSFHTCRNNHIAGAGPKIAIRRAVITTGAWLAAAAVADEGLPEAIIVRIAYGSFDPSTNRRGFDFTAPAGDADADQGGAAEFQDFLRNELVPEIEERYRADASKRILFGQSWGGGMVL